MIKGKQVQAMGSVMALLTAAHSLGILAGSLLAGLTMDLFRLQNAFFLGGLLMSLGVVVFLVAAIPGKTLNKANLQGG